MNFEQYKVTVPEGKSGKRSVTHFTVSQQDADLFNLRCRLNMARDGGYRGIEAGTYTRLMREGAWDPIMSDTPAEISDHLEAIEEAKGKVLINGLGIGVVLNGCLMKPEVEHCTVIELSPDVIKLVEPHYKKIWGDRFEVINADAYEYQPPKGIKYDVVWDDIWDSICADNYEGIKKLKKKYARKTKWHGAWVEYRVKKLFANDY